MAGVQLDPVPSESDAVDLLACLATALGGRHLFDLRLQHRDGRVRRMSATDTRPGASHLSAAVCAEARRHDRR